MRLFAENLGAIADRSYIRPDKEIEEAPKPRKAKRWYTPADQDLGCQYSPSCFLCPFRDCEYNETLKRENAPSGILSRNSGLSRDDLERFRQQTREYWQEKKAA